MMIFRPPTGHELRRNIALALTAVFVITLLMLCDLRLCFMVFLCVVFTMVDVVGIISWWDVQIDVVSATYLVLVVGLCVDYSTHIAHAFKVNRGERAVSQRINFPHCLHPQFRIRNMSKFSQFCRKFT